MRSAVFKKVAFGWAPADLEAQEACKYVEIGALRTLSWEEKEPPRNYLLTRKWWALMTIVADNYPGDPVTKEAVSDRILIGLDHFEWRKVKIDGEFLDYPSPKSISHGKLGQREFSELFDRAVEFIRINLWPTLTDDEIKQQVEGFAG
jgi:hypothetical protein